MNIRLGTFLFGDDDNYVTASIEPVKPAFRESIGRVVDGGRLRVQTIDAEPEGPAFERIGRINALFTQVQQLWTAVDSFDTPAMQPNPADGEPATLKIYPPLSH